MSAPPPWLPSIMPLAQFDGDWYRYIEAVYAVFRRDIVLGRPMIDHAPVACRRNPSHDGKEAGFWHCVSEGADEQTRTPDLRRCERIAWLRAVIDHWHDPRVRSWSICKKGEERFYLWLDEDYLVVLAVRPGYYQLITAFQTDHAHTKSKLRNEANRAPKS